MLVSSLLSGQGYAYGYGRIGVLQEYLLTEQDIDRLVSADLATFTQLLTELKIAKSIDWTADPRELVRELERWLKHETEALVPMRERSVFDILWLKSDASFLAYLLKQRSGFTSAASTEPEVTATAFDPKMLRSLVQGQAVGFAPPELMSFVQSVRQNAKLTPQEIDTAVGRFVAERQTMLAAKSGSVLIQQYTAHHIDLQNILIARRLGRDDKPADHLLPGGRILTRSFTGVPGVLSELVRFSSLPSGLADVLEDGSDEASILLQRALAKAVAHDIALMRDRVLTIEPLFAFAAVAQSQFRVLRTIVVGKLAHLSPADIRKMLPPFLSASPFIG